MEYMEELLNALCTTSMKKVMDCKKQEFMDLPISAWLDKLKSSRIETHVQDTESVSSFLEQFMGRQGVTDVLVADIRDTEPKIAGILQDIKLPPNNLQFAIA